MDKNKKVGLALGGGAALGAAHIGVLKALEEMDIKVDYISGTSIGALIASLYAFGRSWQEMKDIALELRWLDISALSLSKYGILSNKDMGELLEKYIGNVTFEEADIPLAVIATNISTGEKVVLDKGPVAPAVMASTAIPGIFNPVKLKGKMLVDGGIVENVPISPLKKMGAEYIIGVDLNAKYANEDPSNIIEILLNSFNFTLMTAAKIQTQQADALIKPDLATFSKVNINQTEGLLEAGHQEAKNVLNPTS
jgi:NTE family protein